MTNNKLMLTAEKAAETLSGNNTAGFEIYVRGSSSTSVEVKEQKLDAFEESQTWGVGIRVLLADGRMGFAYSTGSEDAVRPFPQNPAADSPIRSADRWRNLVCCWA